MRRLYLPTTYKVGIFRHKTTKLRLKASRDKNFSAERRWSCIVKGAFRKGSIKMFIFPGGSVALYMATVKTGLGLKIASNFGDSITGMGWEIGLLIVVILAAFLGTIMSGTAAQAMYMPLIINMVILST